MSSEKNYREKIKHFFALGEVFGYFFRKSDKTKKIGFNLRAMHTINKISMAMFLVAICFFIVKVILRN